MNIKNDNTVKKFKLPTWVKVISVIAVIISVSVYLIAMLIDTRNNQTLLNKNYKLITTETPILICQNNYIKKDSYDVVKIENKTVILTLNGFVYDIAVCKPMKRITNNLKNDFETEQGIKSIINIQNKKD